MRLLCSLANGFCFFHVRYVCLLCLVAQKMWEKFRKLKLQILVSNLCNFEAREGIQNQHPVKIAQLLLCGLFESILVFLAIPIFSLLPFRIVSMLYLEFLSYGYVNLIVSLECVNACKSPNWDGSGRYDCNVLSCAWKAPRILTGFLASTAHPPQCSLPSYKRNGRRCRSNSVIFLELPQQMQYLNFGSCQFKCVSKIYFIMFIVFKTLDFCARGLLLSINLKLLNEVRI